MGLSKLLGKSCYSYSFLSAQVRPKVSQSSDIHELCVPDRLLAAYEQQRCLQKLFLGHERL
jgi:hypothetical protein